MAAIPQIRTGLFWSLDPHNLDTKKDKPYIIHQALAFGTLEDIRWLFATYKRATVREVFLTTPIKIYTPQAFHFAKLILDIPEKTIRDDRYDKTLPRHIG